MKNTCCVHHCGRKGVWWVGYGDYDVYCERHKDLGGYWTSHWNWREKHYDWEWRFPAIRLYEGRHTPRARRRKDVWRSA